MNNRPTLSDQQKNSLLNCLQVAAKRFDEDVKEVEASNLAPGGKKRLADQFKLQAKEARELYDLFDREEVDADFKPDAANAPF